MTTRNNDDQWFEEHIAPRLQREYETGLQANELQTKEPGSMPDAPDGLTFSQRVRGEIEREIERHQVIESGAAVGRMERLRQTTGWLQVVAATILVMACGVGLLIRNNMFGPEQTEVAETQPHAESRPHTGTADELPAPSASDVAHTHPQSIQIIELGIAGTMSAMKNPNRSIERIFSALVERGGRASPLPTSARNPEPATAANQDQLLASLASGLLGRNDF